jgi:hypothetical protein
LTKRRDTRWPGLVPQQPGDPFLHKAFLPAPHSGLASATAPHYLGRAASCSGEQYDLGSPDMLLWAISIGHNCFELRPVFGAYLDRDTIQHEIDSHGVAAM